MKSLTLTALICCLAAFPLGDSARAFVLNPELVPLADYYSNGVADEAAGVILPLNDSSMSCLGAIFHFALNVTDLLDTNCVHSSPITLSNVTWKITICKVGQYVEATLSPAEATTQPAAWSCDAAAIFNLLPKDADKHHPISINLTQQTFSSLTEPKAVQIISNWTRFVEQYVHDGEAAFQIEVLTGPLSSKVPTNMVQTQQTVHIVLENVGSSTEFFSPEIVLRDVKWRLHIQKLDNAKLAVSLQALDTDPNWSYNVTCNIHIFSFDKSIRPLALNLTHTFNGMSAEVEIGNTSWSQFVDQLSKYVVRDKAMLQLQLTVDEPKPRWEPKRNIGTEKEYVGGSVANGNGEPQDGNPSELPCAACGNKFGSGQIFSVKCGHLFCWNCYNARIYPQNSCVKCQTRVTTAGAIYF